MSADTERPKRKFGEGEPLRNRLVLGDKETTKANRLMEDMLLLVAATDPAERDSLLHKLLHATASLEAMLDKPTHAVAMNAREKLGYEKQLVEMGRKIEQSELAVATAKERLGNARAKRRRQEEYDSLAAVALKEPSRAESTAAIAATEADLERLRTDLVALETKYELRKRQFQLLLHKVHDIRLILKADGELGDEDNGGANERRKSPARSDRAESEESEGRGSRRSARGKQSERKRAAASGGTSPALGKASGATSPLADGEDTAADEADGDNGMDADAEGQVKSSRGVGEAEGEDDSAAAADTTLGSNGGNDDDDTMDTL